MARLMEGLIRPVSISGAVIGAGMMGVEAARNNFDTFEKFLAVTLILYTYGLIGPAITRGLHGVGHIMFGAKK